MARHLAVGIALMVALLVGCAHERPAWVDRGSRAAGDVYYGVGACRAADLPEARVVAANRARAEIARQLGRWRRARAVLLRGVEIREIWIAPDGTTYALAVYHVHGAAKRKGRR